MTHSRFRPRGVYATRWLIVSRERNVTNHQASQVRRKLARAVGSVSGFSDFLGASGHRAAVTHITQRGLGRGARLTLATFAAIFAGVFALAAPDNGKAPRVASTKVLPVGVVASAEMLPAIAPDTIAPPLPRRGYGHQDDTFGADRTDERSPATLQRCNWRREAAFTRST